ncbi:MAG: hypothetical protein JSS44_12770 [Proteobacteria bacterium]|nr:hypothetical protein [Pseudomonadota bacterium]MBS0461875.1 hypothetical protein [Pseudomonadota bacterium]
MRIRPRRTFSWLACAIALLATLAIATVGAQVRIATDAAGQPLHASGSIVIVQPDIELSLLTAGGLSEPNKEWSQAARTFYPQAVHALIDARHAQAKADFAPPDDLDPASRMGQILRLNEAVALSIAQYSQPFSALATKKDPATGKPTLDWSLGPGVSVLHDSTGADYALFTYIRDSYASEGRKALRVIGLLAGAAMGGAMDIGGGRQVGVATLVDLRNGKVVWFHLMQRQSGDLRTADGARDTVAQLLKELPL